jgi:hypothetical protein
MRRDELDELQCITPMSNVAAILEHGILSHVQVKQKTSGSHTSIADERIQAIRAGVAVPNGRRLHEYANLYVCARNPMMSLILYKGWATKTNLCVLRVNTAVLDIPGAVVTDQNAASKYCAFGAAPDGLAIVNKDLTFAESWKHPGDQIAEWRHKAAKCAEVLVPDRVPPEYLDGVWVAHEAAEAAFEALGLPLPAEVDSHLFAV